MEWKANVTNGRIVAAVNGPGNPPNQFSYPGDAIIDGGNNSLIIADEGNSDPMEFSFFLMKTQKFFFVEIYILSTVWRVV